MWDHENFELIGWVADRRDVALTQRTRTRKIYSTEDIAIQYSPIGRAKPVFMDVAYPETSKSGAKND